MEPHKIRELISKYLEAETTVAEEQQLSEYFRKGEIEAEFEEYQSMFGYFESQKMVESSRVANPSPEKRKRRAWIPAAAAAVVLMGIGVFGWQATHQQEKSDLGTFDDPEVALRETRKALDLLSNRVNTGVQGVSYLNEYEQSKNVIFKN